jgi:phosphatidylglycerophosphate synthase
MVLTTMVGAGSPVPTAAAGTVPARYRQGMAALGSAQKPGAGVPAYTRWVNRRMARHVAATAFAIGWTPNMVTAASAVLSLGAMVVMLVVPPVPLLGLPVAVLFAAGYLLDSADGQLARLTGTGSPAGEWLDHVVDAIRTPAIHLAAAVALWRFVGESPLVVVAFAFALLSVGQFMSQILAEQLARGRATEPQQDSRRRSWLLLPTDAGAVCWMFVAWGVPVLFAVVYSAMFLMNLVHTAASMRRKYRKLQGIR